jgi:hypothetical protein
MLKFKTPQCFWFSRVKKAPNGQFELLNLWKTDKSQNVLTKMKTLVNWSYTTRKNFIPKNMTAIVSKIYLGL